ncbi:MAG TPA: undecaprenyl-diphosphate phosphatase [Bdellovibrionota bacterium]|nr:undecaprenyl-diphosphate phosphatase [Bdellovibrionota bacterium]
MISGLEGAILGAIQGLTEFLPISSSGHLVLAQQLFGMKDSPLAYDVLLHLATLLATILILRKQVLELVSATFRLPKFFRNLVRDRTAAVQQDPQAWVVLLILVSTIVTGAIGVGFHDYFEKQFSILDDLWWQFAFTGIVLFLSRRRGDPSSPQNIKTETRATLLDAVWIGLAQGVAIVPAISRSGTTIACALLLGFDRRFAGEYSFLVSLPAIAGAVLLESRKVDSLGVPVAGAVAGFILSFVLGAVTLKLLLGWIRGGKLIGFAYYCWAMAIFSLALVWSR